jgi:hypothetical protein
MQDAAEQRRADTMLHRILVPGIGARRIADVKVTACAAGRRFASNRERVGIFDIELIPSHPRHHRIMRLERAVALGPDTTTNHNNPSHAFLAIVRIFAVFFFRFSGQEKCNAFLRCALYTASEW